MKRKTPKPAPYSKTDIAEIDAIDVFRSLIDKRFVKEDIRSRDKIPNSDGWIELVDGEQHPIGKLEVQIRKIKAGAKKYSCSGELVGYSSVITLPFLLICVDTKSKKAYWKHITPSMPEYKNEQKSFTVYFSETADVVDQSGIYYQKWLEIAQSYQEKLNLPVFNSEFATNLDPDEINEVDLIWIQRFINSINSLFSHEFSTIKNTLYPGIAEFGVGIFSSDEERLYFQVYKIPNGQIVPHICQMKSGSLWSNKANPEGIAEFASKRDGSETPEEIAKNFVLGDVAHAFQQKVFLPYSYLIAKDVLFSFIDTYHFCLGLTPSKDSYSIEQINIALHNYLFKICAAYVKAVHPNANEIIILELRDVLHFLTNNKLRPINPSSIKTKFFIKSRDFSIRNAFEALRYLSTTNNSSIQRPSFEPTDILNNSIDAYSEFLKANDIYFPDSPYLNWKTAVVFEILPGDYNAYLKRPILREHHINNQNNRLSKLRVFARQSEEILSFWETEPPKPVVEIDSIRYNPQMATESDGSFLYEKMPLLNLVYRMLAKDLEVHYRLDVNNKFIPLKK